MERQEEARQRFASKYNCSQSVLVAFAGSTGLEEELALKIGCAFGGGMGREQLVCGAVTGALMALGMHFGMGKEDDVSKKEVTYKLTREFLDEFRRRNGSLNCRELLQGLDMNDPADKLKIEALGLHKNECVKFVSDAVIIVDDLIKNNSTFR